MNRVIKIIAVFISLNLIITVFGALNVSKIYANEEPIEFSDISIFKEAVVEELKNIDKKKYADYTMDSDIFPSDVYNIKQLYFSGSYSMPEVPASNLNGIEYFVNLEELTCKYMKILNLDLSQNKKLKKLWCYGNALSELDLSNNSELEELDCSYNNLCSLDLSQNKKLKKLFCYKNALSELDISSNSELEELDCSYNNLSKLDLIQNIKLKKLDCSFNWIKSLNIENCSEIYRLECYENNLADLFVNPEAKWTGGTGVINEPYFAVSYNYFDYTNNTELKRRFDEIEQKIKANNGSFYSGGQYSNSEDSPVKLDPTLKKCICECIGCYTQTDAEFIYCENLYRADLAKLTNLNISNTLEWADPILNLSGIEFCENLTRIQGMNTYERNIDLSKNTKLESVDISASSLEEINFGSNQSLKSINMGLNSEKFKKFNVIDCPNVEEIDIVGGDLREFNISNCTKLKKLSCRNNNLTELNLSNYPDLLELNCKNNNITSLNLINNGKLEILRCENNKLKSLDITNNPKLYIFYCSNNEIYKLLFDETAKWERPSDSYFKESFDIKNNRLDISEETELKEKLKIIESKILSKGGTYTDSPQYPIPDIEVVQNNDSYEIKLKNAPVGEGYVYLYSLYSGGYGGYVEDSQIAYSFDETVTLSRGENDSYIKVLIWNSLEEMTPIYSALKYNLN